MMVSKDMPMANDRGKRTIGFGWPVAIFIATAMLAGGFAGYNRAAIESGDPTIAAWVGPLAAILFGGIAMTFYLRRHRGEWQQFSPRRKLYWISLSLSFALGLAIAILMQAGQIDGASYIYSDSALTPATAIILSLIWVVGLAVALYFYNRSVDDHERRAYHLAGVAGFYAFVIPCPVWWVLARAGRAPPLEAMPLFALCLIVNALVYGWYKFR